MAPQPSQVEPPHIACSIDAGARRTADAAAAGRGRLDAMASSMSRLDGATTDIGDRLEVIAETAAAISSPQVHVRP